MYTEDLTYLTECMAVKVKRWRVNMRYNAVGYRREQILLSSLLWLHTWPECTKFKNGFLLWRNTLARRWYLITCVHINVFLGWLIHDYTIIYDYYNDYTEEEAQLCVLEIHTCIHKHAPFWHNIHVFVFLCTVSENSVFLSVLVPEHIYADLGWGGGVFF